jgi:hypothetical protein
VGKADRTVGDRQKTEDGREEQAGRTEEGSRTGRWNSRTDSGQADRTDEGTEGEGMQNRERTVERQTEHIDDRRLKHR